MKKLKTENGLIAYKTSLLEVLMIGGMGICDECNTFSPEGGYLVPVLNHWQCKKCFEEFSERAKHYPEDDFIEKRRADYYEQVIGLDAKN